MPRRIIRDIIAGRGAVAGSRDMTVRTASRLMADKRIGALLVLENDRIAGIFTERDALNKVLAGNLDLQSAAARVREIGHLVGAQVELGRVRALAIHHPRSRTGRYLTLSGGVVTTVPPRNLGCEALLEAAGATVGEVLDDAFRRHPDLQIRLVDEAGVVRSILSKLEVPVSNLSRAVDAAISRLPVVQGAAVSGSYLSNDLKAVLDAAPEAAARRRRLCDFLASLTDASATRLYRRLTVFSTASPKCVTVVIACMTGMRKAE
jgi:CBS domain-containing protein